LPHAIGNQDFDGNDGYATFVTDFDNPDEVTAREPIQKTASNDFKTQHQVWMNPASS